MIAYNNCFIFVFTFYVIHNYKTKKAIYKYKTKYTLVLPRRGGFLLKLSLKDKIMHRQNMIFWVHLVDLLISQVDCIWIIMFQLIPDSKSGLNLILVKDPGFDLGNYICYHSWLSKSRNLDSSSCQRCGHEGLWFYPAKDRGWDTKPAGIILHWLERYDIGPTWRGRQKFEWGSL